MNVSWCPPLKLLCKWYGINELKGTYYDFASYVPVLG
jgi:hypothetical protein